MKNILFILLLFLSIPSPSFLNDKEFIDKNDPQHIDKILATDPNTISKEQFYQCEFAIISSYSGSGGHFLDEPLIEWLRKAESSFKARGIKLKDEYHRHFVFADSYFNNQQYEKALEEFRSMKDQEGIELAEWFIHNKGIKNGTVKIKEYQSKIPCTASEITRAGDKNYLFVAYFKGPVYRYNKKNKNHTIIYAPEDKYDWCDALAFNGTELIIKLRDNAGTFIFNNERNEISQLVKAFDIDKTQITVFFGPDFYELSDVIIDNLKLSPGRTKIAFTVRDKSKEVFHNLGIANVDGSDKKLLVKEHVENFAWLSDSEIIYKLQGEKGNFKIINIDGVSKDSNVKVDFSENSEILELAKTRLNEFLETKNPPHYGILGGTVEYEIENLIISPDKNKIAFLIKGEDGHREFYPALYVCDYKGESITLIDKTQMDMSNNVIWLSDNEIEYIKDARLWKAVIR